MEEKFQASKFPNFFLAKQPIKQRKQPVIITITGYLLCELNTMDHSQTTVTNPRLNEANIDLNKSRPFLQNPKFCVLH